jgi:hypothetical protein
MRSRCCPERGRAHRRDRSQFDEFTWTPQGGDSLRPCLRIHTRLTRVGVIVSAADAGMDAIVPATFGGRARHRPQGHRRRRAARRDARPSAGMSRRCRRSPRSLQRRAAARLKPHDRAIVAVRLVDPTYHEIATRVGLRLIELHSGIELGGDREAVPPIEGG